MEKYIRERYPLTAKGKTFRGETVNLTGLYEDCVFENCTMLNGGEPYAFLQCRVSADCVYDAPTYSRAPGSDDFWAKIT